MDNKRFLAAIIATVLGVLPAGAQINTGGGLGVGGSLGVECGQPIIINYSSNKCTSMTPEINSWTPGMPATVVNSNSCRYVTVAYPIYSGEWITQTKAVIIDGIECIPFFWGQWWMNWGPDQQVPGSPDPVQAYYGVNYFGNTGGMNGQVLVATMYGGNGPISSSSTACMAYQEGLLSQNLTTGTVVGAVPEWTCPCESPPVVGDQCPGNLAYGMFLVPQGQWGTIWATGLIYANEWQYITYYQAITYIFPGNYIPVNPLNPYPAFPTPTNGSPPTPTNGVPPTPTNGTPPVPTNGVPPTMPTNGVPPTTTPTNTVPTNGIPPTTTPTNTVPSENPPCPLGDSVSVVLNVQQWLNNTYDANLELQPTSSSSSFYSPVAWSSPNASLYGGETQGYAWITADSSGYYWINFGTAPSSGNITPVGSSQAVVGDQTALIALSAVNGLMPLQAQLAYGLSHGQLGLAPVAGNGVTSMQIPMSSGCVMIGYQWPSGNNPIWWATNGMTSGGSLALQGYLCISTGDPNEQNLTLSWSTTNMSDLAFYSDDPNAWPVLPTSIPSSGSVTIPANYSLGGYNLSALEVTLTGTDPNGNTEIVSSSIPPGTGIVTVANVSTNVIVTNASQATVTWTMDITTDEDPTGPGTYPLVQVHQSGNAYPLLAEEVSTPALGQTFSVTTSNGGPMTLSVSDSCNSYTNAVNVPTSQTPLILEYGLFPDPTNPTLLNGANSGSSNAASIGNPGTVIYQIINNSPGNTVTWTLTDPEGGSPTTGTFTGSSYWHTNNIRAAILTAVSSTAGTVAASAAAPLTHIYLETPILSLPPVLYNDVTVLVTNYVQAHNALINEMIQLQNSQPMAPDNPENEPNANYPSANSIIPGTPTRPGVLAVSVGGNNQGGFWTNQLNNKSYSDNWYLYTPDAPPGLVPLQESGTAYVSTMFNVAPISVQLLEEDVSASTITTNATLSLAQEMSGAWVTNGVEAGSPGAVTSFDFGTLDLGYPTVIIGTRPYYNPTETNLPLQVVFQVADTPCGAYVTLNHAITNLVVQGELATGGFTNYTYTIPAFTNLTEQIPLTNDTGNYLVYGYPVNSAAPIVTNATMEQSGEWVPSATGGTLTPETGGQGRYLLVMTNSGVAMVSISSDNANMELQARSPWLQATFTSCLLNLSSTTNSTSFATTNLITITNCSTQPFPIDVVLYLNGLPPFDIPISTTTSNDCSDFYNVTPMINPSTIDQ